MVYRDSDSVVEKFPMSKGNPKLQGVWTIMFVFLVFFPFLNNTDTMVCLMGVEGKFLGLL